MSNLTKLEFVVLDISDKNYLSWILDVEIHLEAMNLGKTIRDGNVESQQDRAKTMIFIRHHLHEELKTEYLTIKDPLILWNNLRERYEHQKSIILPKARYEWIHLRLQDFKNVAEYNSVLFKISSKLKLYGENITDEDMLERTFSTFYLSNMLLQQQYREHNFKKYYELISCLLVAEQNNELLLKNHQSHLTGSAPFLEVNKTSFNNRGNSDQRRGRGKSNQYRGGLTYNSLRRNTTPYHRKWNHNETQQREKGKGLLNKPPKAHEELCYRCGMKKVLVTYMSYG
jgi:hypothetical protein